MITYVGVFEAFRGRGTYNNIHMVQDSTLEIVAVLHGAQII